MVVAGLTVLESIYSPLWYRVAALRPELRPRVSVVRHNYRGQRWHVLQDPGSQRSVRINDVAYGFVGRMDGTRSVSAIWDSLLELHGESAPTQDEVIQVLAQLGEAELITCEMTPDAALLLRRRDKRQRKRRAEAINPLAFRVPLLDPTPFLDRAAPYARYVFHPLSLLAWIALVAFAAVHASVNWDVIRAHAGLHLLTPHFLVLAWLCYPVVKALHELAHAAAVRVWGGEVHEMGVTLLALVPVPYVDASAAAAFPERRRRIMVGAVGIMTELGLAALALSVWLNVEPGLVRDIAFTTMAIGGVSTLFVNGNPLLRFDGYYVLADAFDLPNLAQRSQKYLAYLAQRYLLGLKTLPAPAESAAERAWFATYGPAAALYRFAVAGFIAFWLAGKSVLIGITAAMWLVWSMLLRPAAKAVRFLLSAPQIAYHRVRAIGTAIACMGLAVGLTCALPLPFFTSAVGVVWLPEDSHVRAGTDGFVQRLLASDGQSVTRGQPLLVLDDPNLATERARLQAELMALDVSQNALLVRTPARAEAVANEILKVRAQLQQVEERIDQLLVRSPADGVLVMPRPQDLPMKFLAKGTVFAYVLAPAAVRVRAALPHDEVSLVRERMRSVAVRLSGSPAQVWYAKLAGEVPAATNTLPSAALGDKGGGQFVTDPSDPDGLRTLESVFLFDLGLPGTTLERVGERAWIRIDHGAEPIVFQAYRRFRQVLLSHFEVDR